jgi:hypothetical protein
VATSPTTTEEDRGAQRGLPLRGASGRRPKLQSLVPANGRAGHEENLPTALDSQNPLGRCRSTSPDDADVERWSAQQRPKLAPDGRPTFSVPESVRAAQACDEPGAIAKSRFRRSERDGHAAAPRFFYPPPVLAQPPLHFVFVLLAGAESRLLRRNPPLGNPLAEITRMKLDPPLAIDYLGRPCGGPQFGGKTETLGRMPEPAQHLALLSVGEFPGASTGVASGQCPIASATIGFHPTGDGTGMNTQEPGDGSLSVARQDMADSQTPPSRQLLLESWRPHTFPYVYPKTPVHEVALLT